MRKKSRKMNEFLISFSNKSWRCCASGRAERCLFALRSQAMEKPYELLCWSFYRINQSYEIFSLFFAFLHSTTPTAKRILHSFKGFATPLDSTQTIYSNFASAHNLIYLLHARRWRSVKCDGDEAKQRRTLRVAMPWGEGRESSWV